MEHTVKENSLTPGEFISLFRSAGWNAPCEEQVAEAIRNSLAVFSVHCGGAAVAMARIVGDGSMTFFIKDVVVSPEFQGKGLGKLLMSVVEEYITRQLQPGWAASAELMSAAGKEDFYRKCGYCTCKDKGMGQGMLRMIRR